MSEPIFPIIETDASELYRIGMERIAELAPGFDTEVVASPEAWLMEAVAEIASEVQTAASTVPEEIFRYYGENVLGIAVLEGVAAHATITVTANDNLGHTIDAGTSFLLYSDAETSYEFQNEDDAVILPGDTFVTFDVACTTAMAASNGAGVSGVELVDSLPYVLSLAVVDVAANGSDDETTDAYLERLNATLQLLSSRPITARDFEISARANFGGRWLALDGFNPSNNLLTDNQASIETNTTGLVAHSNCVIAKTSAQAAFGTSSLSLTASSAANMSAGTLTGLSGIAVTPGETYTGRLSVRSAVTARTATAQIIWYNAAGSVISTSSGTGAADSAAAWGDRTVTAVAPAAAAFAALDLLITSPALSEVHYMDKLQIRRGGTSGWVAGGTAEWNNALTITLVGIKDDGTTFTQLEMDAVQAFMQANRMVNFVVNVISPSFTAVGVTFDISVAEGFDAADTLALAISNVQDFLSPEEWALPVSGDEIRWDVNTKVRYFDVVNRILNTLGVKTLNSVSVNGGTSDVTLPNNWTLVTNGTIAGTVT